MKRLSLTALAVMSLTACGGGSDSDDDTQPGISSALIGIDYAVANFRRGGLTLGVASSASNETVTVDSASGQLGSFTVGEQLTISIESQPAGQECQLAQSNLTVSSTNLDNLAVECSDIEYQLSATLQQSLLRGATLTLSNGETLALEPGVATTAAARFIYDEQLQLVFADPFGYRCQFDQSDLTFQDNISLSIDGCAGVGSVSGLVTNYGNGEPVGSAAISLRVSRDGEWHDLGTAMSDDSGMYTIESIDVGYRYALSVDGSGYLVNGQVLSNSENNPDLTVSTVLQVGVTATEFELDQAVVLADLNADLVSIPASSLVTKSGQPVQGMISAAVTTIDPSTDPSVMPGEYMAWNEETQSEYQIESFGAISVDLFDEAGQRLTLAENETAQINIPVAAAISNPPATMPLYYFDTEIAQWIEDGEATLVSVNGRNYYQGEVSHFTVWNADRPLETVYIEGCVEDDAGSLIANAVVRGQGVDYLGSSITSTNAEGQFSLPVRKSSQSLLSAQSNGLSNTFRVTTGSANMTMEECMVIGASATTIKLTWGENPRDLDTHFFGPLAESEQRFHLYFGIQEIIDAGSYSLDVDDVSSFGPEIVTVSSFALPGRYRYAVYEFSGEGTISSSPARVELNINGNVSVFNPPAMPEGEDYETWVVFDIVVDDELNATVVEHNQYTDDANIDAEFTVDAPSGTLRGHPVNMQSLPAKR